MAGNRNRPRGIITPTQSQDSNGENVNFVASKVQTLAVAGGVDTQFEAPSQAILVMASGDLEVIDISGNTTLIPNVFAGFVLSARINQVTSNTTVASPEDNIIILW